MAQQTTNLHLTKPDLTDFADVRVLNQNFDILDEKVQEALDKDPDLSGLMPKSGGNFTGDITVLEKPVVTIIETVTSDEQTSTKYSDGTLINRINHSNRATGSWIVTFLAPFIDTNYSAVASAYGVGTIDYDNLEYCELNKKTATSIEVKTSTRAGGRIATDYNLICVGRWK